MKVGLFGGSFNPIHNGHLDISNQLLEEKIIDEVWFVPCGNHAFAKELEGAKDRMEMINIAIDGDLRISALNVETEKKGVSYTWETVRDMKEKYDHEFYFVVGRDNLEKISRWKNFDWLKQSIEFILVDRPGSIIEDEFGIKVRYTLKLTNQNSSTKVREKIRMGEAPVDMVAPDILKYIQERELYR